MRYERSWAPTRKVQNGGLGWMVMTIVAWVSVEVAQVEIPAHVATAAAGLISTAIQWLTRDRPTHD